MRVIEPSEIIVEQSRQKGDVTHANPWVRFLARFLDYSLFFLLLLASRKFFHGQLPFGKYENLVPFEYFAWIPIEALLLRVVGTTPGKWFLRTKLKRGKQNRLDWITAMRRSFSVWIRGLGLGIPVLNCICLLVAYNKLRLLQITSWDRDDHIVVTHYPIGRWRIYAAALIAAAGIVSYYTVKNLEIKNLASSVAEKQHRSGSN